MASRAHVEAVLERAREQMARGALTDEEAALFASQQAAQDRAAWLHRHPELATAELPLEVK
ncbi:hypothetical protein [Lysobacter sp. Root96]|uniref:hypothetical protein n=1 Tax=Lysobacter sp. Root96 TaxID=1736612 RepID=UPI0006FDB6D0|nr:hypothetical protein [Lysobacter sp. Root96]KRD71418.1 hypothetical protein ASE45_06300 [Lysobacter sp. Root96]